MGKKTTPFKPVNIKERYVQFLNFFLADLALYFGVQATNTLDIIDALVQEKCLQQKQAISSKKQFLLSIAFVCAYINNIGNIKKRAIWKDCRVAY